MQDPLSPGDADAPVNPNHQVAAILGAETVKKLAAQKKEQLAGLRDDKEVAVLVWKSRDKLVKPLLDIPAARLVLLSNSSTNYKDVDVASIANNIISDPTTYAALTRALTAEQRATMRHTIVDGLESMSALLEKVSKGTFAHESEKRARALLKTVPDWEARVERALLRTELRTAHARLAGYAGSGSGQFKATELLAFPAGDKTTATFPSPLWGPIWWGGVFYPMPWVYPFGMCWPFYPC
jgi:hypothetical protein